ncbi:MAG: hypothetical protein ACE5OZ_11915 [Candidatus Heimdallarchaeota archaeon]
MSPGKNRANRSRLPVQSSDTPSRQSSLLEFGIDDPVKQVPKRPRRPVGAGLLALRPPEAIAGKRKKTTRFLKLFPEGQQPLGRYWNPHTGQQQGRLV